MIANPLRAGDLRNQITIQSLFTPRPRNPDGGENRSDDSWIAYVALAAKIDTTGGREFQQARSVNATLTHEITIRYYAGIKPNMRILFADRIEGNRYFQIVSVLNPNDAIRYSLLLHCTELVDREATT
jgi:SPP1 family predicted phage head-tail adaptor